mgnify:CR=1 FL=1
MTEKLIKHSKKYVLKSQKDIKYISISTYAPTKIVRNVKNITAREIFARVPEVKKQLWGGEFWTDGYYISTIGRNGIEIVVQQYVKNQGKPEEYNQLYKDQLKLFN